MITLSDESQEYATENIKFITGSDTRTKMLYSLKDGALDPGSVRNNTGINSSTLLYNSEYLWAPHTVSGICSISLLLNYSNIVKYYG